MKIVHGGMLAIVVACSGLLLAQSDQTGPRRDGNWEITMEMQMPDMPNMPNMPQGMGMPAMKVTQCITKEDAADPQKLVPPRGRGGAPGDCKVSDYKFEGNKATWSMVCTGAQPMTGTGEFTYASNSYTGLMIMNMAGGGRGRDMAMTMKLTGKRLGDCVK